MDLSVSRRLLIEQLLVCSKAAVTQACKLSSGDLSYTEYRNTLTYFKYDFELALARFGSAIRAARAEEEKENGSDGKMSEAEMADEDKHKHGSPNDTDELSSLLEHLVQHLASAVERRLQVEIVPGIRYDTEAYLEEVLPDLEDRILRRLEDRLGMFKGTHPIYATLCTVLARRLAETITEDVEDRIYCSVKGRLREDLADDLYIRVKERLASAGAASDRDPGRKRSRYVKEEEI